MNNETTKDEIFERKRLSAQCVVDKNLEVYQNGVDGGFQNFMCDQLAYKMTGFIFEKSIAERSVVHVFDRPTFFEWLLRKSRAVKIKINVKDILVDPPKTKYDTICIYEIDTETIKTQEE